MEMDTHNYWEENEKAVKYEKYNENPSSEEFRSAGCSDQLNFATPLSGDEAEGIGYMKKGKQDPMSHRIIEKRRRDRMNNCLADLSRLVPTQYMKKGRGRVEKTEIIEMAIKHIKFLQDRAYETQVPVPRSIPKRAMYWYTISLAGFVVAAEQRVANESAEHYRAGFQEALTEALRYLVQVQGYTPDDGLCLKMAAQLHGHCEHLTKGDVPPREKASFYVGSGNTGSGNTTENNTSSSGNSREEYPKTTIIARTEVPEKTAYREPFAPAPTTMETAFTLQCDKRGTEDTSQGNSSDEPLPLNGRRKREHTLQTACKDEHDDYLHSYKFKNSIERRFSKSQDTEAHDMSMRSGAHGAHPNKVYTHKRRRLIMPKPAAADNDSTTPPTSTTTSNSGSTEEARDTSPQDTSSSESHRENYSKTTAPTQYVPVFALNTYGKYYVPLTVDAACLSGHHGSYDGVLMSHPEHQTTPLHPVTIHVNFQPCLDYHVKKEAAEREWAP